LPVHDAGRWQQPLIRVVMAPAPSRSRLAAGLAVLAALTTSACTTPAHTTRQVVMPGETPVMMGSAVRDNLTPNEAALACFATLLWASKAPPITIAVGEVKDYTGRYSINEGNVVTQGGSLMLFSALGKLGGAVRVAERFDTSIAERELGYTDRRQLGNGEEQEVNGKQVPWLPYYGGTIQASDYFIVGGITEVNFNIQSGGGEAGYDNVSFKGRTYTQSVAIDLRIVDTRTLTVIDAISLQKQFKGYEIGANIFRFFGLGLVDVNIGEKAQEPLQLGIRAAIEEGAIRLVSRVSGVEANSCLSLRTQQIQPVSARVQLADKMKAKTVTGPPAKPTARKPAGSASLNGGQDGGPSAGGAEAEQLIRIPFEVGEGQLNGTANRFVESAASAAAKGNVIIVLVARDTENFEPGKRSALIDQRVGSLQAALANRGIRPDAVTMIWRPGTTDQTIYRDVPGLQVIARLRITN